MNMVYSGCFITSGTGKMVATGVGDHTEFGKIAAELSSEDKTSTPLQEKLAVLGKKLRFWELQQQQWYFYSRFYYLLFMGRHHGRPFPKLLLQVLY